MTRTLLVSGTGTGVGKTTVVAAMATLAVARGERVTVLKPAQTGEPDDGGGGDVAEVLRRAPAVRGLEVARYPDPLAPAAAARRSRRPALTLAQCVEAVGQACQDADLVLVEGAGGLLVHYDEHRLTMRDLAAEMALPVLLVTSAGLGTLNTTALTLEAMAWSAVPLAGLVIGAWPSVPDLAERCNVQDLETLTGVPLAGALAADAALLGDTDFLSAADAGLAPALGGSFDAAAFAQAWRD